MHWQSSGVNPGGRSIQAEPLESINVGFASMMEDIATRLDSDRFLGRGRSVGAPSWDTRRAFPALPRTRRIAPPRAVSPGTKRPKRLQPRPEHPIKSAIPGRPRQAVSIQRAAPPEDLSIWLKGRESELVYLTARVSEALEDLEQLVRRSGEQLELAEEGMRLSECFLTRVASLMHRDRVDVREAKLLAEDGAKVVSKHLACIRSGLNVIDETSREVRCAPRLCTQAKAGIAAVLEEVEEASYGNINEPSRSRCSGLQKVARRVAVMIDEIADSARTLAEKLRTVESRLREAATSLDGIASKLAVMRRSLIREGGQRNVRRRSPGE